jgi:hypothetical protein
MNNNAILHPCRTCRQLFDSWDELANHVKEQCKISNNPHKKDRAGLKWAKDFIKERRKRKLGTIGKKEIIKTPLTDEQRQNKQDSKLILSGETKVVKTYCNKCKRTIPQPLPIEYIESKQALRNNQGILEVLCSSCRKR